MLYSTRQLFNAIRTILAKFGIVVPHAWINRGTVCWRLAAIRYRAISKSQNGYSFSTIRG